MPRAEGIRFPGCMEWAASSTAVTMVITPIQKVFLSIMGVAPQEKSDESAPGSAVQRERAQELDAWRAGSRVVASDDEARVVRIHDVKDILVHAQRAGGDHDVLADPGG